MSVLLRRGSSNFSAGDLKETRCLTTALPNQRKLQAMSVALHTFPLMERDAEFLTASGKSPVQYCHLLFSSISKKSLNQNTCCVEAFPRRVTVAAASYTVDALPGVPASAPPPPRPPLLETFVASSLLSPRRCCRSSERRELRSGEPPRRWRHTLSL